MSKNTLQILERYFILIPILFIVIVKIPHMHLPYFWDEAWSYFPAIFKMYETGPGLLPGALPLWDAKGHPLFFFFVASGWMKLVGTGITAMRILPLAISIGVLLSIYFMLKRHVSLRAANIATILLVVQQLFLAQAAMLLPEMMVTLFLVLSIDAYLRRKYLLYILFASAMVMTKETSIVFAGTFLLFHLFDYLKPGKLSRQYILESLLMLTPIAVYGVFLLLHKKEFGSYLFEDHVGYISLTGKAVFHKINLGIRAVCISSGKWLILVAVIFTFLIQVMTGKNISIPKISTLILLITIIFVVFSALNFYTTRYMLGMLSLFIVLAAISLSKVEGINKWIFATFIGILAIVPLYYSLTKKSNADSDLGFVETVKVHQEMVKFMEEQGWKEKPIAASFNMIFALRDANLGYVSSKEGFSNVKNMGKFREAEIFINESTFYNYRSELDTVKQEKILLKRFENKHAWGEIYVNHTD